MKCPKCQLENTSDSAFCRKCGTRFDAVELASLTKTLETPADELTRGTVFAGRYEIIEELGVGGMGRVYRAHDAQLNEEVALKLIKPEIAAERKAVERFRNEIKIARKITHKNVCRMHDLHEEGKRLFLTMEYVRGEDLKSLIHRTKALTVGTAVSIARQVAEGLAEAHKLGIVHRDLKPGNIMIDKDGNAKIMDFGIARVREERGVTGEGAVIGTPEYMSPEQVEGKLADARSDIYSLGVILFEMVVGCPPFEGETPFSIANKHKTEPPPVPKKLVPQLPEALNRLILRCLEKDKANRFQTGEEFAAEITAVEEALPASDRVPARTGAKPKASREFTVKLTPKKLLRLTILFLALTSAGIIFWRVARQTHRSSELSDFARPSLAVLYFENKTGNTQLDYLREALAELLNADLSQSRNIRVVTGEEIYAILKRLGLADAKKYSSDDIKKLAAQAQATHVLRGSFIKAGERFVITAGLQNPASGESMATSRLEAQDEYEIIRKVDDLTKQVKEGLDLSAAEITEDQEKEAGQITTYSPEALNYYVEGRKLAARQESERAIRYMEKAVEKDPDFAMAYRAMSIMYFNLGNRTEAQKFMRRALELSARLPESERLLIEADQHFLGERYAKAIEILEQLIKAYPENIDAYHALGKVYAWGGDSEKACEPQEYVVKKRRTATTVGNLAVFYMSRGLYRKAEEVCRAFLEEVEDNWLVRYNLCASYAYQRDFNQALREAERCYLLNPDFRSLPGDIMLLNDDIAGANEVYLQVFEKDQIAGRKLLYCIALTRGKFSEAISLMENNLEASKGSKEQQAGAYGRLSDALVKAGRHKEAYRSLDEQMALPAEAAKAFPDPHGLASPEQQISRLFRKGRLLALLGSFDEAKKTAEELRALAKKGITSKKLRMYEYIMGLIEFGKKDYRNAAGLLKTASDRLEFENDNMWDHPLFFDALARANYELGDFAEAREGYEKVIKLTLSRLEHGDIYVKAFYMLGKIAERQGDKAKARSFYRRFLDFWKDADPGLPEVEDTTKRLAGLIKS